MASLYALFGAGIGISTAGISWSVGNSIGTTMVRLGIPSIGRINNAGLWGAFTGIIMPGLASSLLAEFGAS